MTRWQRIRRGLGWTWRKPSECPHPREREFSRYFFPEPWSRVICLDCGKTVEIFGPLVPGHRVSYREPYK